MVEADWFGNKLVADSLEEILHLKWEKDGK